MRIEINAAGLWKSMRILALGLVLVFALGACKRPHTTGLEDEIEPAGQAAPEPDDPKSEPPAVESFLDPLLGAPWLGHAEDGALVKVEFFADFETGTTLCSTTVKNSFGRAANTKSPFSASSELSNITWEDGKSRGRYDPDADVVESTVTSRLGKHQVKLRQVTVESHPELATARKSIPDDDDSQAVHQKFAERLENGARWWKSIDEWEKLVTPEELVSDGSYLVLIRPAGKVPIKVPALEPGGSFDIPLIAHLPPGTNLSEADQTLGIMAELQHEDSVRSMWVLCTLSPGALVQDLKAHWAGEKSEPALSGAATIYIYLCKTGGGGGGVPGRMATTNQPVSNLLKIDIEIGGEKEADAAE